MNEAALWELINAGRERMNFAQRRLWDVIGIDPEQWTHRSPAGEDRRIWVVALIGRSVISYNEFEYGFDCSRFARYGEIAELGWGQVDLEGAVQHVLNEVELGHQTRPPFPDLGQEHIPAEDDRTTRQDFQFSSVKKRLDDIALAQHEGVGDVLEGREVDVRGAGADDLGEALVERGVFGFRLVMHDAAIDGELRAAA